MKQPQNRQTKYNIQQKTIRKAAVDVKNTVYKRHGGNDAYTPKDSGALPKQHALPLPQEDVYGKPLPQKNRQNGKYRLQPQGKVAPEIEKDQHKPNADKQCAEHGEYDADAVVRALLIRADMPALAVDERFDLCVQNFRKPPERVNVGLGLVVLPVRDRLARNLHFFRQLCLRHAAVRSQAAQIFCNFCHTDTSFTISLNHIFVKMSRNVSLHKLKKYIKPHCNEKFLCNAVCFYVGFL